MPQEGRVRDRKESRWRSNIKACKATWVESRDGSEVESRDWEESGVWRWGWRERGWIRAVRLRDWYSEEGLTRMMSPGVRHIEDSEPVLKSLLGALAGIRWVAV